MVERANGRMTVPQIFIGATHVGGCDDLHELERAGKLDPLLATERRTSGMSARTFTVGLVQMRSGLDPARQSRRRREADRRSQGGRRRLRADARDDQHRGQQARRDCSPRPRRRRATRASPPSASWRASSASIFTSARSAIKISPERAANRSFLIDPQGEIVARYDKIHMFDVDLAGGESYRELRSYRPGEQRRVADLPWGRLGLTICYDLRFPTLYRALAEAGASFISIPGGVHQADRRSALACADARPRDREPALRVRGRAGRQARERPRDLRPFTGR